MAKQGNQTAYQQVQPLRSDLTENMWRADEKGQQLRDDKLAESRRKKAEDEKQANDLGTSLAKIKFKSIGMASIDHMYADVAIKAKDRLREAYLAKKKDPNDVDAIMTIKNLESLPDNLKLYTDKYGEYITDISKGVQEGRYSRKLNLGQLEKLDRTVGQNNGYFDLAKDGSVVGVMIDPENDGFEFKPIKDVLDGSGLDAAIPAADYFGSQKAIKTNYSTHKSTMADPKDPYNSISTENLREEDIAGIKRDVQQLWGTADDPTDFAKSVIADRLNKDPEKIDENVFNKYRADYAEEIIGSYGTNKAEKYNFSGRAADGRLAKSGKKGADGGADDLRMQVDGALSGDEKYVQNLVGINLDGYKDGTKIEKAEFVNGKLVLQLSDGEIVDMDPTADKKGATGQLLRLVRPKDKADQRLAEYDRGKSKDFETKKPEGNGNAMSKIKAEANIPKLKGMKKAEAVKNLELMDLIGFETTGSFWESKVKGPDGKVYDLKSDADIKLLTKYAQNPKQTDTAEKKTPQPDKKETSDKSEVL